MSTPVRVTADIVGATVFNTKNATLEWTPEGRIRIVETEPGQQPQIVLDTPPQALAKVTSYQIGQQQLIFKPTQGRKIRLSLQRTMLAPLPQESAAEYSVRQATLGAPSAAWWTDSIEAAGTPVSRFGWGKYFAIVGGTIVGVIALIVLAAALGGAFS